MSSMRFNVIAFINGFWFLFARLFQQQAAVFTQIFFMYDGRSAE